MIGRAIADLKLEMHSADQIADPTRLHRFTREAITQSLAQLLDSLIDRPIPSLPAPLFRRGERSESQLQEALR